MINHFIKFRGVSSRSFGLRLVDDINFSSPERDIELVSVSGRNGALIKDNNRFDVVNSSFPFVLYNSDKPIEELISELNGWLFSDSAKWSDFEKSWDPDYLYKAIYHESFSVSGSLKSRKKCILSFKLHPVKYLKSGLEKINATNGSVLSNPLSRPSKPLIKLIGTGDVMLTIGAQLFRLRGVSGHIIIDCDSETASYEDKTPQYDKVFSYPFPKLMPGINRISWDNQQFTVEIVPRWEDLAT